MKRYQLKKIKKILLDLIYPPRCPICHDIVEPGCQMICGSCVKKLPLISIPKCEKCGKPVSDGDRLCYDCTVITHDFSEGIGIFLYEEIMRSSMYQFKYSGRKEYGRFYGMSAWIYGKDVLVHWNPQIIIPIPVHKSRKRQRGYNQAEVIADELGKHMGIAVEKNILFRNSKTIAQKELSVEERRDNLAHAFVSSSKRLPWKRVLLVDDIYTTGSTMDSAAKVLKKCGIEEIYALSICIGKGFVIQ